MTKPIPVKKPPQSVFGLGKDLDKLNIINPTNNDDEVKINDREGRERTRLEITLPTSFSSSTSPTSLSPSSSLATSPAKDYNHIQKLQDKLHSATLKVDSVSKFADITMQRIQERVAKCKDSLRQTADAIEKQNAIEWETTKQRRLQKAAHSKIQKENKLKREAELKFASKRREQLLQLENLKTDIMDARSEKRHALKWLVKRQEREQDEDATPTQILNASNFFTIGDCDDDDHDDHDYHDDQRETLRHDGKLVGKITIDKEGNQTSRDEHMQHPKEPMTMEEMRLAARAEAAKEISMAKEVKHRLMEKLAKEREDAKLALENNGEEEFQTIDYNKNDADEIIAGVEVLTLCELLDCAKEELYESDLTDLSSESVPENMENLSSDINSIQHIVNDLIKDIEGYNTRLIDVELMQSIILAENAALKGKDEFNIGCEGEQLCEIKSDGKFSTIDMVPIQHESQGANMIFGFERISERAGQTLKKLRLAAAMVDKKHRLKQKRQVE